MSASSIRAAIRKEFPTLDFSVRKVSFSDLARSDCYIVQVNGKLLTGEMAGRLDTILKSLPVKAVRDKSI